MIATEILTPMFLRECEAYRNYLARGRAATLRLPGYETDAAGHIFIQRGEVFCRIRSCEHRSAPFSSTPNLRAHLLRHGLQCQDTRTGRISQEKKTEAIQWYAAVVGADDEDEEENDE